MTTVWMRAKLMKLAKERANDTRKYIVDPLTNNKPIEYDVPDDFIITRCETGKRSNGGVVTRETVASPGKGGRKIEKRCYGDGSRQKMGYLHGNRTYRHGDIGRF